MKPLVEQHPRRLRHRPLPAFHRTFSLPERPRCSNDQAPPAQATSKISSMPGLGRLAARHAPARCDALFLTGFLPAARALPAASASASRALLFSHARPRKRKYVYYGRRSCAQETAGVVLAILFFYCYTVGVRFSTRQRPRIATGR